MQETSALYKKLLADPTHFTETSLTIGESGRLITETGDTITFGGTAILVATSGAESGFRENRLIQLRTSHRLFGGEALAVGSTVAGEIDVTLLKPLGEIPQRAMMIPYVRLANGFEVSEWLQKGVYFIDTREESAEIDGEPTLHIHGFDAMLKAEQPYPNSSLSWPATDLAVAQEIAQTIGVKIDPETVALINKGYTINLPTGYSCREVLGYIAGMYAGWWIISDFGELRLVTIGQLPKETSLLIDNEGDYITFGGDRIIV